MSIFPVIIGFLLTLAVYSYLWGDNPLYRAAVHLLVGVSTAYASLLALRLAILPSLRTLVTGQKVDLLWLIPVVLGALLLLKVTPQSGGFGNGAVWLMVAVGSAVALIGAVSGTLVPQVSTVQRTIAGVTSALLTMTVLYHFQMTRVKRSGQDQPWTRVPAWQRAIQNIGRGVLMLTLGAVFAGTLTTSLMLFVGHLNTMITDLGTLIP